MLVTVLAVAVAVAVILRRRVVLPVPMRMPRRLPLVRMAVRVHRLRMALHQAELRRRDSGAEDTLGRDFEVLNRQAAERRLELVEREARIEQGAEDHVARSAVEAVEVEDPHGLPGRRRKPETVIVAYG